jgi:hypothetical protein
MLALPQGSGFTLYLLRKSKRISLQSLTQIKDSNKIIRELVAIKITK